MRGRTLVASCRMPMVKALRFVAVVCLVWGGRVQADTSRGGSFLALGHGARAHAMGGSGVALLRDDSAVYWNPANLAWLEHGTGFTLMHADILPGIDDGYETLSFARAMGERLGEMEQVVRPTRWGYGLFISHMGFDFDSGRSWTENTFLIGAAYALNNFATLGVGFKVLRLDNDFESADAKGAGVDLGLSVLVLDRLTASVVGRDTWTRVRWDTSTWETLEPSITFGFEYRPLRGWTAEADFVLREDTLQRTVGGVEWQAYRDILWLRGGLTVLSTDEQRTFPSAGAGVRFSRFVLDYAASFDDEDALEVGQRVSLQIHF
ncbi:MAG: hypothetical protein ACE5G2_07770 [Candidatus Krumholzibacteriia bacterium]